MRGDAFTPVPNRGMITISIMLANIMQGLDNTILNVALPHIQGSLSASLDQIAWTLTSYIVCSAIMMPLTGWLAGRFGIKYIFLVSMVHVDEYLGPANSPQRQILSHVMDRIARRMRNATAAGSTSQWRAMFGLDE
jgi:Major Facilitator Superfamily